MAAFSQTYDQLCHHAREIALLGSIESLLEWDERTYMPQAAGGYRAEQMSHLAGLIHERWTDARMGQWLGELTESPLAADPSSDTGATIRELRRLHDRKVRLPKRLVEELAHASVTGQQVWVEARAHDDFAAFRPALERIVRLKREEADALTYRESPYDALLEDYEPGELTSNVGRVLAQLRDELVPLAQAIVNRKGKADASILARTYPVEAQEEFGRRVAAQIGFDFTSGRLDVSAHPFCTQIGRHDSRMTTRYQSRDFTDAFFGILHETGHGLYQQGLRADQFGLPLGDAVSLGIHESQSRLWENLVGRSRAFWEYLFPDAQKAFGQALGDVAIDDFYRAINVVRPSLIRVGADEVTYNMHIFVRFELEQALVADDLRVADLPAAWNEKYRAYLGIESPNDTQGVLQDIHWSGGAIGYFATYTLGNLYAAQFFAQAEVDLGPLDALLRAGNFAPLLEWLRMNIHQHGRRYTAAALVERVTGRPLAHEALIAHLRRKFSPLYDLR